MATRYVPRRGGIVWLSFTPQAGHAQAGRCPALVVSPRAYNAKVGLAVFCPITSQVKGYPFEVKIPPRLQLSGVVLSDQIRSLDWRARDAQLICRLPGPALAEVMQKMAALLFEQET